MPMNITDDYNQLDVLYRQLNRRAEKLYEFVLLYNEYIYEDRDYGTGKMLKMMEIHALTHIEENPGITATELAKALHKTKGAVSQTVKKLLADGLIERGHAENNSKSILLYATESGRASSYAHKLYDVNDIGQTLQELRKVCSDGEIDAFYKVVDAYIRILHGE